MTTLDSDDDLGDLLDALDDAERAKAKAAVEGAKKAVENRDDYWG